MKQIRSEPWRSEYILHTNWKFDLLNSDSAHELNYNDEKWEDVTLPHTWNGIDAQNGGGISISDDQEDIYGDKHGYHRGVGWYRTAFKTFDNWGDKSVILKFEAASRFAEVYINGEKIGEHKGAFGAFSFDISEKLSKTSQNILAVKVDNSWSASIPPTGGDFPIMGGIYRPVHLIVKDSVSFSLLDYATEGVYLTQKEVSNTQATLDIMGIISNILLEKGEYELTTTVKDAEEKIILDQNEKVLVKKSPQNIWKTSLTIKNPHLWHGKSDPYLYTIEININKGKELLDTFAQKIGFRSFEIKNKGEFYLNGILYPLNGVCRHQDWPDIGWAISDKEHEIDFNHIDEIGAKTVRLAHYQQADIAYRLCDEKGILVWAENCLVNSVLNNEEFHENAIIAVTELIKQTYNHCSIFTWGLANEILHGGGEDPIPLMTKLQNIAKKLDPYRPTVSAVNTKAYSERGLFCATDLVGWNTYPHWYKFGVSSMKWMTRAFSWTATRKGFCISEYGAGASIKHHEVPPSPSVPRSQWHPEEWQAIAHERDYADIIKLKYVWGSFAWNMFDFASVWRNEGDAPGINDKGIVTRDRKVKKDAFYFYKSQWASEPFVYITSRRFTERKDALSNIKIYSNCENVKVTVNDQEISPSRYKTKLKEIYFFKDVQLKKGVNNIKCIGTKGKEKVQDSCEWKLE